MEFLASIRLSFQQWIVFSGRSRRQDFWFFQALVISVLNIGASIDLMLFHKANSWCYFVTFIFFFMPAVSVTIRRLHDVNRSGWYWFLWFVPIVGWIALIIWFCAPGTEGDNRFGADPLQGLQPKVLLPAPTNFVEAVKHNFMEFGIFSGRARRLEYWYWRLFAALVWFSGLGLDFALFGLKIGNPMFFTALTSVMALPGLGLFIRRLHDLDRSGWYYWLGAIPIIGWIILLIWLCTKGTDGDNRFGPDPLRVAN